MSRYVARISCVLCLLILFSAIFWCSDARAQQPVFYKIVGTDFQVTPTGTPAYNMLETTCPLRTLYMSKPDGPSKFEAATKAAKAGGDPDSAPYAVSPDGKERVYFYGMDDCQKFFQEMAQQANPGQPPVELACGAYPPGAMREACKNQQQAINGYVGKMGGALRVLTNTPPTNGTGAEDGLSKETIDKMQQKKQEKDEAERACFEGTLDRIGQYWLKQNAADCVKVAVKYIKRNIKEQMTEELKHMEKKQAVNTKSDGQGSSPGAIISMPSIVGVAQALITAIKYVLAIAKVSAENAADLDYLLNDCLKMSDKFSQLQVWRKGVLGGLCKQVESLVERQLTQCIRISAQFDLKLPQFSAALQCPFNVSVNAYVGTQGSYFDFNCVQSSPVQTAGITWGGRSLLGSSGGLEGLFSGKCFKAGGTSPTGATGSGTRVPGVDCGTLATNDPVRTEALQGVVYLTPGNPTANGWVAGRSETVVSPSGVSQQITRCDFYVSGARTRTTYVYGSGGSCNASSSGFTSNGYETNVACYSGGYTPAAAGSAIPDACLYPIDCLNSNNNYVFDDTRLGTNGCPASTQPLLDTTRRYPVVSTGGVGGGTTEWRDCSDFSTEVEQAPVCCDPQKQDCRQAKSKNIPICQCDQGDSSNTVIDPATGKCDPNKGGGMRTCCTASLNGGTEGCTTLVGMPASQVCANGDQCLGSSDVAGTDGDGNPITAGQANTSKPSPFSYLAISPDVTLDTIKNTDGTSKQCCSTPWCNVCPQHYANAYGMAMARANWTLTRPGSSASLAALRTYNNAILGKGWPFTTSTNANGETTYTIGINPSSLTITRAIRVPGALGIGAKWEEDESTISVDYPMLHMSDKLELKPSTAQIESCNDIGPWKIGYTSADNFGSTNANNMGYVYDSYVETPSSGKYSWKVYSGLPEPRETPMDYLNRLQASAVDDNGTPKEPIELCSDVIKICAPGTTTTTGGVGAPSGSSNTGGRLSTNSTNSTLTSGTSGTDSTTVTPLSSTSSAGMISMEPTTSATATTSSTGVSSGSASSTSSSSTGAVVVPSAGSSSGSLF